MTYGLKLFFLFFNEYVLERQIVYKSFTGESGYAQSVRQKNGYSTSRVQHIKTKKKRKERRRSAYIYTEREREREKEASDRVRNEQGNRETLKPCLCMQRANTYILYV